MRNVRWVNFLSLHFPLAYFTIPFHSVFVPLATPPTWIRHSAILYLIEWKVFHFAWATQCRMLSHEMKIMIIINWHLHCSTTSVPFYLFITAVALFTGVLSSSSTPTGGSSRAVRVLDPRKCLLTIPRGKQLCITRDSIQKLISLNKNWISSAIYRPRQVFAEAKSIWGWTQEWEMNLFEGSAEDQFLDFALEMIHSTTQRCGFAYANSLTFLETVKTGFRRPHSFHNW